MSNYIPTPAYYDRMPIDISFVFKNERPAGEIMAATWSLGTPGHSWQAVAQGKAPLAHKSMLYAAKVLAGAAIDLINDPDKLAAAKAEHAAAMADDPYVCPIPKDVPIPVI